MIKHKKVLCWGKKPLGDQNTFCRGGVHDWSKNVYLGNLGTINKYTFTLARLKIHVSKKFHTKQHFNSTD